MNNDLPKTRTYYINIYPQFAGQCGTVYATRALADQMASQSRIACKAVLVADGDGLQDPDEDAE